MRNLHSTLGQRTSGAFGSLLGIVAGLSISCAEPEPFECETDAQCNLDGERGECQVTGYCSYFDQDCPSQQRYHEDAPDELAGECVPMT